MVKVRVDEDGFKLFGNFEPALDERIRLERPELLV